MFCPHPSVDARCGMTETLAAHTASMAYYYKGSISFGLVYLPVALQNAVKQNAISFNQIDRETMSRVRYKKTREADGREVEQGDIVKGFEYEKGKYVLFEEKDFERLKTKRDKNITIERFVSPNEVDPVYFEKTYYVHPTGAEKAFSVLAEAMETRGKAAIAKAVLGTKETLLLIRAEKGRMLLSTLYFYDEVQTPPAAVGQEGSDKEKEMALAIVDAMTGKFEPETYRDEYRERVMEAIGKKIEGQEIAPPEESGENSVKSLMDALEKSLSLAKQPAQKPKAVRPKRERAAKKA